MSVLDFIPANTHTIVIARNDVCDIIFSID